MRKLFSEIVNKGILWSWNNLSKIVIAVFAVVVVMFFWNLYEEYQHKQQTKYEQLDREYAAKLEAINKNLTTLLAEKQNLAEQNKALDADVQMWKKRAQANPPPKPVPPPPSLEIAVMDLAKVGVEFKLSTPLPSQTATTPVANIPTIWTWHQESLRIKPLELAYENQLGLTNALTFQVDGLKKEIVVADKTILTYQEGEKVFVNRVENLQDLTSLQKKQIKQEKFKGNLKAAGAFILGAVLKGVF